MMRLFAAATALMRLNAGGSARPLHAESACRDRFAWPFASSSIWNTALGSSALLLPARIYNLSYAEGCALRRDASRTLRYVCSGWNTSWTEATCLSSGCCYDVISPDPSGIPWCYAPAGQAPYGFHNDPDFIVQSRASDPVVAWMDQGTWEPGNHCLVTGPHAADVPLPDSFSTECGGGNNGMALLLPDNRTLLQMQPAFRLGAGSPLLALYHKGAPVAFPWEIDILGDGAWGAHGGSGLSAIGGTIRAGELAPGAPPLRHALKLELFAHDYYYSGGTAAPYADCFRWPALGCDGYAHDASSPLHYNGSVPGLQPGALLALPASAAQLPVATAPAALIRDALATYGAYLVDDTATDDAAICMEQSVSDALLADYGIHTQPNTRPGYNDNTTAFYNDLVSLFRSLHIVANNANGSAGGGGTPLAPPAPPIC